MKLASYALRAGIMIVLISFVACSDPKPNLYEPPLDVVELIAGDSSKTWKLAKRYNGQTRMNMEGCFMSYRQTFYKDQRVHDNNGDQSNCGETLNGRWELTKDSLGNHYIKIRSEQYKRLMRRDSGYVYFKILYASMDSLTLSFTHNQYGTRRTLTDYLVTEELIVPDRDFHW